MSKVIKENLEFDEDDISSLGDVFEDILEGLFDIDLDEEDIDEDNADEDNESNDEDN